MPSYLPWTAGFVATRLVGESRPSIFSPLAATFTVETVTLHFRDFFSYGGSGESVPPVLGTTSLQTNINLNLEIDYSTISGRGVPGMKSTNVFSCWQLEQFALFFGRGRPGLKFEEGVGVLLHAVRRAPPRFQEILTATPQ